MTINKNEKFIDTNSNIYISTETLDLDKKSWFTVTYNGTSYVECHTTSVVKILPREDYPEYYL